MLEDFAENLPIAGHADPSQALVKLYMRLLAVTLREGVGPENYASLPL